MLLLIDNFDSFTYNLQDYILQTGEECRVYRNNEIDIQGIRELNPEGIIISPGPGRPEDHPLIFQLLKEFSASTPMLGVCLGFQAMGEFYGMELIKGPAPSHGKTTKITHSGEGLFWDIPSPFAVTRYHSLILSKYSETDFDIISFNDEGIPMAGKHSTLPLWGVQFHPEAILTEHGLNIIKNWIRLIKTDKF